MTTANKRRGRKAQRSGVQGEGIAESHLRSIGVFLVEKIETPKICLKNGGTKYTGKVSGDRRGVLYGGRSVHCEVKKTSEKGNLAYSAVKPHQREWLSEHARLGGLSLLAWVDYANRIYVMQWHEDGIDGYMAKRSSITPEQARMLDVQIL